MKFELFELDTIKYILSSFWTFLGFCIILIIITGDLRRLFFALKNYFTNVGNKYRNILAKDKFKEEIKKPNNLKLEKEQ